MKLSTLTALVLGAGLAVGLTAKKKASANKGAAAPKTTPNLKAPRNPAPAPAPAPNPTTSTAALN